MLKRLERFSKRIEILNEMIEYDRERFCSNKNFIYY